MPCLDFARTEKTPLQHVISAVKTPIKHISNAVNRYVTHKSPDDVQTTITHPRPKCDGCGDNKVAQRDHEIPKKSIDPFIHKIIYFDIPFLKTLDEKMFIPWISFGYIRSYRITYLQILLVSS